MADVLKKKGYAYQFVFSEAAGHVDRRVQLQTMPEAFEWVWIAQLQVDSRQT